ncbi:hypothetical protein, partial [Tritonibacter sp. SIMBA_163]|uniref:hypothetical protein n=1 Tax=Tritonibacter sp. SIMBA_163 TaxID=3080868 RepID=UPI00397F3187
MVFEITTHQQKTAIVLMSLGLLGWGYPTQTQTKPVAFADSEISAQTIQLELPSQEEPSGGLIAVDVNNDDHKDFIVT